MPSHVTLAQTNRNTTVYSLYCHCYCFVDFVDFVVVDSVVALFVVAAAGVVVVAVVDCYWYCCYCCFGSLRQARVVVVSH